MQKSTLMLTLGMYIVSAVVSFAAFSYLGPDGAATPGGTTSGDGDDGATLLGELLQIDPSAPKDQVCPLNGKMYTLTEREAWEKRRPLAVMIENAPDARPQSGLSRADVMFEAVAEGGVTRFMAMMYCGVQAYDTVLAPVRSARTYFIDYASGFNLPLYVHVGGANIPGPADALGQISQYGWSLENDLNQFSIGYPTFVRNYNRLGDKEVATEHTMETTTEKLWAVGLDREWTNMSPERKYGKTVVPAEDWKDGFTGWTFQDEVPTPGSVTTISHEFWSGYSQYALKWEYNPQTNTYKRTMGGEVHVDLNNNEPIEASTVIVLLTDEKGPIDEAKHMLYRTVGTGDVLIFQNGLATEGTWTKKDRESELRFVDSKGSDIALSRGLIWISVVDQSTKVEY